jgi:hypothetical protein
MANFKKLRFGYVPYTPQMNLPGDRRRFVNYARKRGLNFEIADPRKTYDVVVLSERADISVWRDYAKGKIVYDLIDSYLAIPRTSIKGQLRGLAKFVSRQSRYPRLDHWRAIEDMCRRADAVVCTTAEQQRDIAKFCGNVHVILDIHTSVAHEVKRDYAAGPVFKLVWEGLAPNVMSLFQLRDVLQSVNAKHRISLNLVTDPEYCRYLGKFGRRRTADLAHRLFDDVVLHEWNERSCSHIICGCDLAVIPLDLGDPFAAGKPENKLLLFWRMGMPAVASATPAYAHAMQGAGLAMACRSADDWQRVLEHQIADAAARQSAGESGKRYAEAYFGEAQLLSRWDALFATLV